jgi:DNA-binding NtrC family response regulator
MISQTPTGSASQSIVMQPAPTAEAGASPEHSLMVIGSSPERMQRLRAALGNTGAKITWRSSTAEIIRALDSSYEVVIVDVEPERLTDMLRAAPERTDRAVVLVLVECGSLNAAANLAGVLPIYRAMACSYSELVKLVNWRFTPSVSPPPSLRRIL